MCEKRGAQPRAGEAAGRCVRGAEPSSDPRIRHFYQVATEVSHYGLLVACSPEYPRTLGVSQLLGSPPQARTTLSLLLYFHSYYHYHLPAYKRAHSQTTTTTTTTESRSQRFAFYLVADLRFALWAQGRPVGPAFCALRISRGRSVGMRMS